MGAWSLTGGRGLTLIEEIVASRADTSWWTQSAALSDPNKLQLAFTLVPRKLGTATLTPDDLGRLASASLPWLSSSTLVELARMALLSRAPKHAAEWFRVGDNGEKRAVLRAFALLPSPETLVELGQVACRSSVQSVFEGLCCENPWPADHFPEPAFNQMVLKALFTEVKLARIVGLDARKNVDLARMAQDYASERRAAGRSVPADIGTVL